MGESTGIGAFCKGVGWAFNVGTQSADHGQSCADRNVEPTSVGGVVIGRRSLRGVVREEARGAVGLMGAVRLYISVQWCSVGQSVSKGRSGSAGFGLVVRVQMEDW